MAQHGYLHDRYDKDGFGRREDRDDRDRGWRERNEDRGWRGRDDERGRFDDRGRFANRDQAPRDSRWDSDRGSMFGWGGEPRQDSYREHRYENRHDEDRGFFESAADEVRSWFGDDDDRERYGRRTGAGREQWRNDGRGMADDNRFGRDGEEYKRQGRGGFSAHQDDHYRSWRDRQMQALDRDYQEYCREREQRFHSDFDSWRRNRRSQDRDQQSGASGETLELSNRTDEAGFVAGATTSPTAAATLGTNNSENTGPGRSANKLGDR